MAENSQCNQFPILMPTNTDRSVRSPACRMCPVVTVVRLLDTTEITAKCGVSVRHCWTQERSERSVESLSDTAGHKRDQSEVWSLSDTAGHKRDQSEVWSLCPTLLDTREIRAKCRVSVRHCWDHSGLLSEPRETTRTLPILTRQQWEKSL